MKYECVLACAGAARARTLTKGTAGLSGPLRTAQRYGLSRHAYKLSYANFLGSVPTLMVNAAWQFRCEVGATVVGDELGTAVVGD